MHSYIEAKCADKYLYRKCKSIGDVCNVAMFISKRFENIRLLRFVMLWSSKLFQMTYFMSE